MDYRNKQLNRNLLIGWSVIVTVLAVTYLIEMLKGVRTPAYVFVYVLVTALPAIVTWIIYINKPDMRNLRYIITIGYFFMYLFSLATGSTFLVFTYIFPLLNLIILYHEPKLVAAIGFLSIGINIVNIVQRICSGEITLDNSKEAEIQMALIILCFGGCYVATRLYDSIEHKNIEYVSMLDDKNKQIQEMTLQTISTVANTIDAKDEYTKGHSQRVSVYSSAIAKEMGWSEEEVNKIRYIALLHDIGKIGVPDNVLNKPGKLTDAEYELMKKHTTIGGEILKDTGMFDGIALGALYHHERYDGKGYPKGLEGEEIPLIARIICVADAYDAMTSTRVYRKRLSDEDAMAEIEKCKGKQFDPQIADIFIKALKAGKVELTSLEYDKANDTVDASHKLWQKIVNTQNETNAKEKELDYLTAVYNKSAGERKISAGMLDKHGSLMMVDIENMILINKKKGVLFGDHCISKISNILSDVVPHAIVARFSGAKFICYYEGVRAENEAVNVADEILKQLAECKQNEPGMSDIELSVGIALTLDEGTDYDKLLDCVDKALYYVKQSNSIHYYIYRRNREDSQIQDNNIDLENVVEVLKDMSVRKGAMLVNYPEFEKMYKFISDISKRNEKGFCVVMFSIMTGNADRINVEERDLVMDYLEKAIIKVLRTTDVTTRYSSTQQLVVLPNTDNNSVKQVANRVLNEFYKIYAEGNVSLEYAAETFDSDGVRRQL